MSNKPILLSFVSLLFAVILQGQTSYSTYQDGSSVVLNLSNARAVIPTIDVPFESRYTPVVESYLKTYFLLKRDKAEKIVGKAVMYFPLFERMLREEGMPESLKYLAITESALNPRAISRVGAGGLWQFMPETGRHYNLYRTSYVDDRFDPEKSTKAALQYLKKYHTKYGNWALAIASYNSGPGRVSRAIKRSRSKNFWKLKRYLPRETRSYVPGFIAAAYLMKYYDAHGVQPKFPSLDMQMTESTMVFSNLSFHTISQVTGVAMNVIRNLNPTYLKDEIPSSRRGHKLMLPQRVMIAMKNYISGIQSETYQLNQFSGRPVFATAPTDSDEVNYYKAVYTVGVNDNLFEVAKTFNCTIQSLMAWNNLKTPHANPGRELTLYQIVKHTRLNTEREKIYVESIPIRKSEMLPQNQFSSTAWLEEKDGYLLYQIKRGESLLDIVAQFPGNTIEELMKINELSVENQPKAGMKIKVNK